MYGFNERDNENYPDGNKDKKSFLGVFGSIESVQVFLKIIAGGDDDDTTTADLEYSIEELENPIEGDGKNYILLARDPTGDLRFHALRFLSETLLYHQVAFKSNKRFSVN